VYRRLAELGLARRARDGKWVRGPRGLVATAWRTGGYQLRRARLRRYRRERRVWRARLDAWYRPAALIRSPRSSGSAPPAGPPPAAQPAPLPRHPRTTRADLDPASGHARLSYRRAASLFRDATGGWTLHQLRHSRLTHLAEAGVQLPILMAKSRHTSLTSLAVYAQPTFAAAAATTAALDPDRRH